MWLIVELLVGTRGSSAELFAVAMPPRYETYARLKKDTKLLDRMRFSGIVVEWFWYLAFGRPRRGLYSLEPTDVAEVEVWNVRNADSGVEHKSAVASVTPEDARLALRAATLVVEAVEKTGLRIIEAMPAGPPRQGDHDLVVERRGVRGRGGMEVKLMQVRDALENARQRDRASAAGSPCWVNCRKTREGFVERFLAIWQIDPWSGGTLEQRLEAGVLKIDVMRATQDE